MKKKSFLMAALAMFVGGGGLMAQTPLDAKNAYAYDVTVSTDEDQQMAMVSYRLNAPATEVKVLADIDGTIKEYDGTTNATKENNLNSAIVPLVGLEKGTVVKISVKVTSPALETATVCATGYQFYHPQGVATDNDPESPYFGRIYATECMDAPNDTYLSGPTNSIGQALYVFDPTFAPLKNKDDKYGFYGGLTFNDKFTNGQQDYDPRKVRISKDGRVFVSAQNEKGVALYELNPEDLNADWTPVIYGTPDAANPYQALDAEGNFICATNISFDVKGEGEDLQVLMLSDNAPGAFAYANRRVDEYNLGTNVAWNKVPSKNIAALSGVYTITSSSVNIVYDNEGGIWYFQYRGTPTDAEPAIVHVNAAGEEDFKDLTGNLRAGGVCFNADFSLIAFACASKQIGVYTITKDEAGKPVLTQKYKFDTTIGGNTNDLCWDYANNLYIVGNSNEWIKCVALPRESGDVVTPAAAQYAITIGVTTSVDNFETPANVTVRHNTICVEAVAGTPVQVYNVAGQLLYNAPAVNGTTQISGMPAGINIVRVADKAVKVFVK
ncbi:MAG: hypothetical protein ACI3Z5_01075 [Paludibacteraceae bacterium]